MKNNIYCLFVSCASTARCLRQPSARDHQAALLALVSCAFFLVFASSFVCTPVFTVANWPLVHVQCSAAKYSTGTIT